MRILVTGAGSGVGRATSALLATRGHEVVATARDTARLRDLEVAARLYLDVTDPKSVEAAAKRARLCRRPRQQRRHICRRTDRDPGDGSGPPRCSRRTSSDPVRLIQAFVPAMRERRSGVVVNVSSVAGRVAQPLDGYYSATKHALEAISEALYVELAHFGVRVVIVEPGFIAPSMKGPPSQRRARRLRGARGSARTARRHDAGRFAAGARARGRRDRRSDRERRKAPLQAASATTRS